MSKQFSDLTFKVHPTGSGVQARLDFENGYGVSVIQSPFSYTDGPDEFELAVMKRGSLCYDTPITDDVLGHLSRQEVSDVMAKVAALPEATP